MKTRTQKTLDEMMDFEVLAMALDDLELSGLIKWKPDAGKRPTVNENRGPRQANSDLVLAERDSQPSFADHRSLDDQVRQLLEAAQKRAYIRPDP